MTNESHRSPHGAPNNNETTGRTSSIRQSDPVDFRLVVEMSTTALVVTNADLIITYLNRSSERVFGYPRHELIGSSLARLLVDGKTAVENLGVRAYLDDTAAADSEACREVMGIRADGTTVPLDCKLSAYHNQGKPVLTCAFRDISERKRTQEEIQRTEQSFERLIEQIPNGIGIHREGRFVYVNRAMVDLLGYDTSDELLGKLVSDVVHPDDRKIVAERIRTMLATGKNSTPLEERFLRKDGSIIYVEVVAIPLVFQGKPTVVAVGQDLTERREMTSRIMQMDRMVTVGTLAAGVGHEINNPLTYVVGNLELSKRLLDQAQAATQALSAYLHHEKDAPSKSASTYAQICQRLEPLLGDIRDRLNDASAGTERIRDIVRDLRTFSRADDNTPVPLLVHQVIDLAASMANNEIKHRAQLIKEYGHVAPVLGHESRLGQVVLNLLINAAHAMPEGEARINEIRAHTFMQDDMVVIEVRDTGAGIPPENMSKIFEPFFTTKTMDEGTGLGLSICRQIVRDHGGRIEVESELGKGSVFRVLLPKIDSWRPVSASEPPNEPESQGKTTGKILIVDDEDMIRRLLLHMLDEHDVRAVASAKAALDLLQAGERFDIILCDLMMPEMTGMDFYDLLSKQLPDQARRTVFMTGGSFTPSAREFLNHTTNRRIEKPFGKKQVTALIAEALASVNGGDTPGAR